MAIDIMILHPPGSGGDMFRTLLMMAITPNKYELGEFNYYGNKTGLLVDGEGLGWIDDVGQCCNILQHQIPDTQMHPSLVQSTSNTRSTKKPKVYFVTGGWVSHDLLIFFVGGVGYNPEKPKVEFVTGGLANMIC